MSAAIPKVSGASDFAKTCSCCSPVASITKSITIHSDNGQNRRLAILSRLRQPNASAGVKRNI